MAQDFEDMVFGRSSAESEIEELKGELRRLRALTDVECQELKQQRDELARALLNDGKHVCGEQGFGGGINDECAGCTRFNAKTNAQKYLRKEPTS